MCLTQITAWLDKLELKWDKLTGVTTDDCSNLTGKNGVLLKWIQDKVTEIITELKLVFLHCILHREVLCLTKGRALQVSITGKIVFFSQIEEFSTYKKRCSEDFCSFWIYLCM